MRLRKLRTSSRKLRTRGPRVAHKMVEQLETRQLLAAVVADFDGVASYVSASNPLVGSSEFTVEAWVRRPAGAKGGAVIASGQDSTFWFGILNNNRVYLRTGLPAIDYLGTTPFDTSAWTHIAATYAQNEFTTLYINGQADQVLPSHDEPIGWDHRLNIGAAPFENGLITDAFLGNVSGLRIWNYERSAEQIRQTMTVEISEPRPGLVANFPFSQDLGDLVSGTLGQANGAARRVFVTPPSPPELPVAQVDKGFATLTDGLSAAATAYVPDLDQAILAGGFSDNVPTSEITSVDAATGMTQTIGQLGAPRAYASAAYASSTGKVYVFGGSGNNTSRLVEEIDPLSGARRSLPSLPVPVSKSAAVYHPTLNRIYLFGGHDDQNQVNRTVMVFDVVSGETTIAPFTLPIELASTAAAYSPINDAIYLFGGSRFSQFDLVDFGELTALDDIIRVDVASSGGTARLLPSVKLPESLLGASAVVDSSSQLIYLVGGQHFVRPTARGERVLAFDPHTEQLWETQSEQTDEPRFVNGIHHASVIYSQRQRHVLQIGGNATSGLFAGITNITRIPLGDGPVVSLSHWDFPAVIPGVNDIAGDERKVLFGTRNDGLVTLTADTSSAGVSQQTTSSTALLASGSAVTDVAYDSANDTAVLAMSGAGARIRRQNLVTRVDSTQPGFNTNGVSDSVVDPSGVIFYGTDSGIKWLIPGTSTYQTSGFTGHHFAIANRGRTDEVWSFYTVGTGEFRQHGLYRMLHNRNGFVRDEFYTLPDVDNNLSTFNEQGYQLEFDAQGNFWIRRGTFVTFIPAGEIPDMGRARSYNEVLGNPVDLTVDGDNRVWSALTPVLGFTAVGTARSGGITAREQQASRVVPTTGDWNWLNAPLGTRELVTYFSQGVQRGADVWSSSVTAVAGVHEKVWLSQPNGNVVTYAPRWSQLDDHNDLGDRQVDHVWTVRGRLFVASLDRAGQNPMLSVLQPDGKTWDNRPGIRANSLHGDSQGRIWLGTSDGVRLYEVNGGWDLLTDRVGVAPAGPIHAIAEDSNGRIWIASGQGLTLFDRDRFVTTLTSSNSGLPNARINSLYVDSTDTVWIGTEAGLASLRGSTVSVFTTQNGLPDQRIADIASIASGELILSTPTGLVVYSGTRFRRETLPAGLNSNAPPLAVDEYGRLWAGNGLRKAQDDWQGHWATNSGLRTSSVTDVAFDGAGRIWFAHGAAGGISVRSNFLPPLPDTIPVITSITPTSARFNDVITIRGGGFGSSGSDVEVTIGGQRVRPASVTDTEIQVIVTASMTSGNVSVVRKGRRAVANDKFCAIPTIDSFTPSGGSYGVLVEIAGKNFDPGANVRLRNGSARPSATSASATRISTIVQPADQSGTIVVANQCGGATDTSDQAFRRIDVSLTNIVLNQGMPYYGLVEDKPTLVQSFAHTNGPLLSGERTEIDAVQLTITGPSGSVTTRSFPFSGAIKLDAAPNGVELIDIANSVNVNPVYFRESGPHEIKSQLMRRGVTVSQNTATFQVAPNLVTRVLLVPVMKEGYSPSQLEAMKGNVERNLGEARNRILPLGTAEFEWSADVVVESDNFELDDALALYGKAPSLDRARSRWNHSTPSNRHVGIAMGVVDTNLIDGTTPGFAFWPDASELFNFLLLDKLDALCDIGNAVVSVASFGLLGSDDGCHLNIPSQIGWVAGGPLSGGALGAFESRIAHTMAHEIGHVWDLVKPWAYNGSFLDNFSHSVNDEIQGPNTCGDGGVFDWSKSLYQQPGVTQPIVNPMLTAATPTPGSDAQFRPQNDGLAGTQRAKATMSYACGVGGTNSFFEPADLIAMNASFVPFGGLARTRAAQRVTGDLPQSKVVSGARLYVAGTVDSSPATGRIQVVESFGEAGPLSPSVATGVWLVQLDANGQELSRLGVYPASVIEPGNNTANFFSATMLREPNVHRIELRRDDVVLDTFTSSGVPSVQLFAPAAGTVFSGADVEVRWSASDPQGNSLSMIVEYSHDNGQTWVPVGSRSGRGQQTLLVRRDALAGTQGDGRFRVTASNGLASGFAVSNAFSVTAHAPRPFIHHAFEAQTTLEGQLFPLSGGAYDVQDRLVAEDRLRWYSDREGALGQGSDLTVALHTVGWHTITLEATNSLGLVSTTTHSVYVGADYDYDGVSDQQETEAGLNPLDSQDVYQDLDGDHLNWIVEWMHQTDPSRADSDGDGRSDGDEVLAGDNPLQRDAPRSLDYLQVTPTEVNLRMDMSQPTALSHFTVGVFTHLPADWTLDSDVDWLESTATRGTAPGQVTVRVQNYRLGEGATTGHLIVRSATLGKEISIPVTVTNLNRDAYFDMDGDGNLNSQDRANLESLFGTERGSPAFDIRKDLNRDGVINAADVDVWVAGTDENLLPGDLNGDGRLSELDIDLLAAAIRNGDLQERYDLNRDGRVNRDDRVFWVESLKRTYFGDANLDGEFNSTDLVLVFQRGEYEDRVARNSLWADGDWTGDGEFDSADFVLAFQGGGYEQGPRSAVRPLR